MNKEKTPAATGFIQRLEMIEDGILVSLLLFMIIMAVLQIFLRNLMDSGILWGDSLIRVMVLWIGLIGAMVASRKNHHISIDIVSRYLPPRMQTAAAFIISIFTTGVCAVMAWYSLSFVLMDKQDGLIAFGAVPAWICESIIPFAFFVITLRYLTLSFAALKAFVFGERP